MGRQGGSLCHPGDGAGDRAGETEDGQSEKVPAEDSTFLAW